VNCKTVRTYAIPTWCDHDHDNDDDDDDDDDDDERSINKNRRQVATYSTSRRVASLSGQ